MKRALNEGVTLIVEWKVPVNDANRRGILGHQFAHLDVGAGTMWTLVVCEFGNGHAGMRRANVGVTVVGQARRQSQIGR